MIHKNFFTFLLFFFILKTNFISLKASTTLEKTRKKSKYSCSLIKNRKKIFQRHLDNKDLEALKELQREGRFTKYKAYTKLKNGETFLTQAIKLAAKESQEEGQSYADIAVFLATDPQLRNLLNNREESPIILALSHLNISFFKRFLSSYTQEELNTAFSPLFHALKSKKEAFATELITRGASFRQEIFFDKERPQSPLSWAIQNNLDQVVISILDHPNFRKDSEEALGKDHLSSAIQNNNDSTIIKRLLLMGFDKRGPISSPNHPLILAYKKKRKDILKLLLESGLDPSLKNDQNISLNFLVIQEKNYDILDLLLQMKVSFNEKYIFKDFSFDMENFECTALLYAMQQKDHKIIEKIIAAGHHDLSIQHIGFCDDIDYYYYALWQGELKWMTALEKKSKTSLRKSSINPLRVACQRNHQELINFFSKDKELLNLFDDSEDLPLELAIKDERYKLVEFLLRQGALLSKTEDNYLEFALQQKNKRLFKILWEAASEENLLQGKKGIQEISKLTQVAIDKQEDEIFKILIEAMKLHPQLDEINHSKLLFSSLKKPAKNYLNTLLEFLSEIHFSNERGETILSLAMQKNLLRQVKTLLKKTKLISQEATFIDPSQEASDTKETPLNWAFKNNLKIALMLLKESKMSLKSASTESVERVFLLASEEANFELLIELINNGFDISTLSLESTFKMLESAILLDHYRLLSFFRKHGIDITCHDKYQDLLKSLSPDSRCFYYLKFLELNKSDHFNKKILSIEQAQKTSEIKSLIESILEEEDFSNDCQIDFLFHDYIEIILAHISDLEEILLLKSYLLELDISLCLEHQELITKTVHKLILVEHHKTLGDHEKKISSERKEHENSLKQSKEKTCCVCLETDKKNECKEGPDLSLSGAAEEIRSLKLLPAFSAKGPAGCDCHLCEECAPRLTQFILEKNGSEISTCPGCQEIVVPSFFEQFALSEDQIMHFAMKTCEKRLAQLPAWHFCPTADCLNGKQIDKAESLIFNCVLCSFSGCIRCGQNHERGDCQEYLKSCKELENILSEGEKAPPTSGHPRDQADPDYLKGRFRPCYWCGTITEREVDGTIEYGQCNSMICKNPQCKKNWHFNYGCHELHPRFVKKGQVFHDFSKKEQRYQPLVKAHF